MPTKKNTKATVKKDVYQELTDKIVADLQQGVLTWRKPWNGVGRALNYVSGKGYKGVNRMLLDFGEHLTFKQAKERGGNVRKGEKGTAIMYFKPLKVEDKETGEEKTIPMLKTYTVFHISQCDGIESKLVELDEDMAKDVNHESTINAIFERMGIQHEIQKYGDSAHYIPKQDVIFMPDIRQFKSHGLYYSTIFHELAHATGIKKRLNRVKYNDYAFEELVAELTATFVMQELNIPFDENSAMDNNTAYIQSWLDSMGGDKKYVYEASKEAEKACKYMLALDD